jgi:hypothetical protein
MITFNKINKYGQILNCGDAWKETMCNDGTTECCTMLYTDKECCASHQGQKLIINPLLFIVLGIGTIGIFLLKGRL